MTHDHTIHMIGHGHIDPTWLWRWTEGYEEVRATFRSALDRMRETPDFRFTASSACLYQWVQESEPTLFAEIQERVAEGRWEIAGGWWLEPDCNIPCGEAFVRHGLYGQRYFQQAFGTRCTVGFNPDSFGHAGMLPQILRQLGMNAYVYMRPMPVSERDYPGGTTFHWESPDGSRVLTCNLAESYNGDLETLERIRAYPNNPHLVPGQRHILGFFGVGNHGGGPTKAAIVQIQQAQQDSALPNAIFSTLRGYLDAVGTMPDLPVVRDELQHHARGCYSVHAGIKQMNRRVEHALMSAERMASLACLLQDAPYPKAALEGAWKDLLYNQFHDILAGTSIATAYEDAMDQLGGARHQAQRICNRVVQGIAREIDTTPEGNTIVVFNSLPWPVTVPVIASPIAARTLKQPLHLVDDAGAELPVQAVRAESITTEVAAGARHAFLAEVPALGYRCFHARSGARHTADPRPLEATPDFLENAWWRLELDPHGGQLTRLFDRQAGVEVLHQGALLECLLDASDTWSHELKSYRTAEGTFGGARRTVVERGDVLATVQAVSSFGRSTAVTEYTLYRDTPQIDCNIRVNWQEAYRMLKLRFDTAVRAGTATFETPYGHQVRPASGNEEPGQQWFDLTGTVDAQPYGFTLLNDGQYGFDVLDGIMRVSLLRSPAFAHHDPARVDLAAMPEIIDQGWHRFGFQLLPHAGPWQEADVVRRAWQHNQPPLVHVESAHPGRLPAQCSALECDAPNVLFSVLKQQEDGTALVVRGYETNGVAAQALLLVHGVNAAIPVQFGPHEIKTFLLEPGKQGLHPLNLLEEPVQIPG